MWSDKSTYVCFILCCHWQSFKDDGATTVFFFCFTANDITVLSWRPFRRRWWCHSAVPGLSWSTTIADVVWRYHRGIPDAVLLASHSNGFRFLHLEWPLPFPVSLTALWDFDPSGAPVDGLWHGHLDVTRWTALFSPQPFFDALHRDTHTVSQYFPILCATVINLNESHLIWFICFPLFGLYACALPLCGRCVSTAAPFCHQFLDSGRCDRWDTRCRHHSAEHRWKLYSVKLVLAVAVGSSFLFLKFVLNYIDEVTVL